MNREVSFYPYLTPEEQDLLDRSMKRVTFRKGQVIHRHGDSCVGLIFIRRGRLAFSVLSEEGREITLFRVDSGGTCILSAACVFRGIEMESQITAETNTDISVLPAPVLAQFMGENVEVERIVYKQAVQQYADVLKTMQQIVFFSLEKRLASFLHSESARRDSPAFSMTHEQIARCIGSSREVVTRTLNQFATRGIVALGRGTITFLDQDALRELLNGGKQQ